MTRFRALLALLLLAAPARGQPAAGESDALSGTLRTARERGALTIGYRESSFPFSYATPAGPRGYSIDLCLGIVAEVERTLGREIRPEYAPLTPASRIDAVVSGQVDLECGSTTSNVERQRRVAFSPIIFVAGTKLMVRRDSGVQSYRDLAGKTIVVTAGTTNEAVIRALNEQNRLGARVVTGRDHGESYAMVADGRADAFATDDVLLYGLIAQHRAADRLMVVGEFLS
ncbi:MAG: amino acid ABC transporter substrate-binding protein, partial [Acetobacteraceae bacterium]|nr:amino acid ABC transporter substrate-binding protein [Acetobacteraceae bacterium]